MKTSIVKLVSILAAFVMTMEAQATRYAPNVVKVDFISIGAGKNEVAYSAINHILELAEDKGHLDVVNEIQIGHEGHTKMCIKFSDEYYSYYEAIARVAVTSESKWKATVVEPVRGDCDDELTKRETNGQLGPFTTNKEASIVCNAVVKGPNPDGYQARLELYEGYRHRAPQVSVKFLQSSRRARYAAVDWKVDSINVSDLGTIEYGSNERGEILLSPSATSKGFKYIVEYKGLEYVCN